MNRLETDEPTAIPAYGPASPDDYFTVLKGILPGIATALGESYEIVLHDFRDLDHSIIAIEGAVTNRHVGGSITQLGLSLIAQGEAAQDQINYITRTPEGRVLKSSTLPLRDSGGCVFGAFCINMDVTELRHVARVVTEMAGAAQATPETVTFTDDVGQVIEAVIAEEEMKVGITIDRMNRTDRLAIFRALDERGAFSLQRSMPRVAEYLGISRATAYAYLDEIRSGPPKTPANKHGRTEETD